MTKGEAIAVVAQHHELPEERVLRWYDDPRRRSEREYADDMWRDHGRRLVEDHKKSRLDPT